jgi:TM2 domain-containing membrane protein YozV
MNAKKWLKENKTLKTALTIILIVIVIVLIIITVGWLFSKLNKSDNEDAAFEYQEDDLEAKKKKLKGIEYKITPLESIKVQIEKTEKKYLIAARLVIGFFMICLNVLFAHYFIYFDGTFELNKILSFNSAVLLCYSFIAFLLYGTPGSFVAALKNTITNYLTKKHIHTLTELEKLIKERDMLLKDIEALEKIRNQEQ